MSIHSRKTKLFHYTWQSWAERKEAGGMAEAGGEVASAAPDLGRVMTSFVDPLKKLGERKN